MPRTRDCIEDERETSEVIRALGARRQAGPDALAALERFRREHFGESAMRVGRYRLRRILGSGGMGVVFEAIDEELGRDVAIKLFRAGAKDFGHRLDWLRREARALAQFSDPHVVNVFDFGVFDPDEEGNLPAECMDSDAYLVMELIQGEQLSRVAARFGSWDELRPVCLQIARALGRAHALGIVHADVKPANLLVTADGVPKLVDFGLATMGILDGASAPTFADVAVDDSTNAEESLEGERSRSQRVAGTPPYMAPELHHAVAPNPLTDQYALCCSIYELVFGRRPFVQETLDALVRAKRLGRIDWSSPRFPIPRSVRRALARGLAPRPENRFESLEALVEALDRRRPRWRPVAVGALAVVGIAAALGMAAAAPSPGAFGEARATGGVTVAVLHQHIRNAAALLRNGHGSCHVDIERMESAFQGSSALGMDVPAARLALELADLMLACDDDRSRTHHWLRQAEMHFARGEPTVEDGFRLLVSKAQADGAPVAEMIPLYESRLAELDDTPMKRDAWVDVARNLAWYYAQVQRFEEAMPLANTALTAMLQDHGDRDLRTARARKSLALVHFTAEEHEAALSQMRDCIAVFEAELGPAHRDTLLHRGNLASLTFVAGRHDEALDLFEALLEPLRDRFGPHHDIPVSFSVNSAMTMTTIALERGDLELLQRAEGIIRGALVDDELAPVGRERRLGSRMHALGLNLSFQGRLAEAEQALTVAIGMLAVAPEDAIEHAQARYHLARAKIANEELEQGVSLLEELLETEPTPVLRQGITELLVMGNLELGRLDRARELFETLSLDHLEIGTKRMLQGEFAAAAGHHREAMRSYATALTQLDEASAPRPSSRVRLHQMIARSAEALGQSRRAQEERRNALEVCRRALVPQSEICQRLAAATE